MYFSEFLETCTIGWVLICEGRVGVGKRNTENAFFFEKFYRGHDLPHPRRSLYTPPVETPAPSAPGTTAHHRQQGKPRHAPTHTPGRWTRCTGLHSIPDRPRRADQDGGGAGERAACPKLCRFGHSAAVQKYISFLNTFVARATENPFTVSQKCDIIMSQE